MNYVKKGYPTGEKHHNFKHGMRGSLTHGSWRAMIRRCHDEKSKDFARWGAKGITVCDRWRDVETGFLNFLADMGPRLDKGLSIDRIDNEKGYFKENCRWATASQQVTNQKRKEDCISKRKMDWDLVFALHEAGFLGTEIAFICDVSPKAVSAALKKMKNAIGEPTA